jgi:hypothetical protein
VTRFETLNNERDDIIHRLWGGGIQPGSLSAAEGAPVIDAGLHRTREERMKTKSTDARANIRRQLSFIKLREVARKMAQLNSEIFASFLPPGTDPDGGAAWAYLRPDGRLEVVVSPKSSGSGSAT